MNTRSIAVRDHARVATAGSIWFGICIFPIALLVLGVIVPGAWIGIGAFLGFFILCVSVYRWNHHALILMLPLLIYKFSSFVSLALISLGFFIPELGRYGEADLSPATYLAVTAVHFILITLVIILWMRRRDFTSQSIIYRFPHEILLSFWLIFGIVSVQALVLIYTGMIAGFPLLTGTDRFIFRGQYADATFIYILNYKSAITLLVAMLLASNEVTKQRKLLVAVSYALLFGCYMMFGEKFHSLLLTCALLFLPFLVRRPDLFSRYLRRVLPAMSVMLSVALALVFYIYSDYGTQPASVTFERMFGRMSQQSQLWYLATRTFAGWFEFDHATLDSVWHSLTRRDADAGALPLGIGSYYFIFRFSPPTIQESVYNMQGLIQFTQVSEAFWLSVAGLPGLVLYLALSGGLYASVMVMLARSLAATNIVLTYLWGGVFVTMMTSMNQALLHQVLGVGYLRWYVLAAGVHIGYQLLQLSSARAAQPHPR